MSGNDHGTMEPSSSPWPGHTPISDTQSQAVVRLMESAPLVARRDQFFGWTQRQLQALIPHQVMVCGAYQRHRRGLVFDVHHTVPLSAGTLQALCDTDGTLVRSVMAAWVAGRGRPLALPLSLLGEAAAALQTERKLGELLVHGVSRPQRPPEIETMFMFATAASGTPPAPMLGTLDLLLPQLHRTFR